MDHIYLRAGRGSPGGGGGGQDQFDFFCQRAVGGGGFKTNLNKKV